MPRRKISIAEAVQALKGQGLNVTLEAVPAAPITRDVNTESQVVRKVGDTALTIVLHSQHSVGSGGSLTMTKDGDKVIADSSARVYGPGRVTVSTDLAAHLLHQDQLARQADDRFLDGKQRSYLIMQRVSPDGRQACVGQQVDNGVFNNFGVSLRETMVI